ncbi:MAG: hypothetical protein RJQ21_10010 [Rhodospirillales bacterium]
MFTLDIETLSDERCAPVSPHHVTAGRSLPVVAGLHANGRADFAISAEKAPAESDDETRGITKYASGTDLPVQGNVSCIFATGTKCNVTVTPNGSG